LVAVSAAADEDRVHRNSLEGRLMSYFDEQTPQIRTRAVGVFFTTELVGVLNGEVGVVFEVFEDPFENYPVGNDIPCGSAGSPGHYRKLCWGKRWFACVVEIWHDDVLDFIVEIGINDDRIGRAVFRGHGVAVNVECMVSGPRGLFAVVWQKSMMWSASGDWYTVVSLLGCNVVKVMGKVEREDGDEVLFVLAG
jgi:hypothetical protein